MSKDVARCIARTIKRAGGRALLVGGCVRDEFLGITPKDFDIEVYGLDVESLRTILSFYGEVMEVGASFGVFKIDEYPDLDISLPRRDSKVGEGHKGFTATVAPSLSVKEAARRRDFTMNSVSQDPLTGEMFDPFFGTNDLAKRTLRITDPATFGDDPLRALRAAQFCARFELVPDAECVRICSEMDLSSLSRERFYREFVKLLMAPRPAIGLYFMRHANLLRFFPELARLVGCPQDPEWHPEGDCFVHTAMTCDEAARMRSGDLEHDLALMFGALCHDLGKPGTTTRDPDGHIRSRGHEKAGEEPTRALLARLIAPQELVEKVVALVIDHLAPTLFIHQKVTFGGYRRLGRRLQERRVDFPLLAEVAVADRYGRTLPRSFPEVVEFMANVRDSGADIPARVRDVVMGRHLIERGMKPGRHFGDILRKCREVQDEAGLQDPEAILGRVLAPDPAD